MFDVASVTTDLQLSEDGIWMDRGHQALSYPSDGHERSFEVEDGSFWFQHRNACIAAVVAAFPPGPGGTIVDVGGGNGFVAAGLAREGFDVALIEPGLQGARNARRRGVRTVVCGTTESVGLAPGCLPAVGLFDVIEHLSDDHAFSRSMHDLLAPGGRLYATVPAHDALWSHEDASAGHFRRYTRAGICGVLEGAGLQVEFSTYLFRPLIVPILLLRALPYRLGLARAEASGGVTEADHAPGGGLGSRLIRAVLAPELRHLRRCRPMRLGASCLIVARRPTEPREEGTRAPGEI